MTHDARTRAGVATCPCRPGARRLAATRAAEDPSAELIDTVLGTAGPRPVNRRRGRWLRRSNLPSAVRSERRAARTADTITF